MAQGGVGTRPRVAFVLSGGAALGASQVGMLRALLERGIKPDLIVGTSIGAWNGLWLATHCDLASIAALERFWKSITLMEMLGSNPMLWMLNLSSKRPYLVADDGMKHIFRRAAAEGGIDAVPTFASLPIPLLITATNLTRGRIDIFKEGLVQPALFASSAIPGLFPPVIIDGDQYVDGGLLDNDGLEVAAEAGAEEIYVLSLTHNATFTAPVATLGDLLERSFHLVASRHVHDAATRYADRARCIIIEDDHTTRSSSLDFRHAEQLITTGYRAATRVLDQDRAVQTTRALADGADFVATNEIPIARWFQQPVVTAAMQAIAWVDCAIQINRERVVASVPALLPRSTSAA